MIQYDGRSKEKTHIPGKPHPDGIKVWGVAQSSFLITWNYHTPGEQNGPTDVKVPPELGGSKKKGTGGNKTQAVVAKMMDQLPQPGSSDYLPQPGEDAPYHLWLDNLFTSTRFLEYMRSSRNIGITGTTRLNAGILDPIVALHKEDKGKSGKADKLPWGTTLSLPTESNMVCQVAWKDSSLVTFMSTVKEGTKCVKTVRTRPKQGKKREEQKHKPFKGQPTAILEIPDLTDCYNNNMGAVDGFDHLTAMNSGLRCVKRGAAQAVEHWLLRTVLVNTYVVGQIWRRENELVKLRSQVEWRDAVIEGLLEASQRVAEDTPLHPRTGISHRKNVTFDGKLCSNPQPVKTVKPKQCKWCLGHRPGDRPLKRRPLGELASANQRTSYRHESLYSCSQCKTPLCTGKRGCFLRWHT